MENPTRPSFLQDLWDRRFFQYLATYVAVCWGVVQFLLFAVDRYQWDNSTIEKFLLFAIICLPAVAVFIYNHGRPGDDEWKPFEKVLMPATLVLAVGSTFFVNSGNTEPPPIDRVSITTEEGDTIVRNVPSLKNTNRIVFFPFENKTTSEDDQWMRHGLPLISQADIEQDMRIYGLGSFMQRQYSTYKEDIKDDILFGKKLKIAKDRYSDEFVTGVVSKEGDLYSVEYKLFNTKTGRELFSKVYTNESIYPIIDQFSQDLNKHLYSVEFFEETTEIDLPADNLYSNNTEAMKYYIESLEYRMDNNIEASLASINKAIEIDEKCAECYALKGFYLNMMQDLEGLRESIGKASALSTGLPERQRLLIKYYDLNSQFKSDKSKKLLETWIKLYPKDYQPYDYLMNITNITRNWDEAKKIGELALANGHEGSFYNRLATLYMSTGEFEEAEKYIRKFSEKYPEQARESTQLGDLLVMKGKLDEAAEYYEEASIYNSDDFEIQVKLADVQHKLGDFDASLNYYNEALKYANRAADTVAIYQNMISFFMKQGKCNKAFEMMELHEEKALTYMQPFMYSATVLFQFVDPYTECDKKEEFKEELNKRFPIDQNVIQNGLLHQIGEFLITGYEGTDTSYWERYQVIRPVMLRSIGPDFDYFAKAIQKRQEGAFEESNEFLQTYVDSTGTPFHDIASIMADNYSDMKDEKNAIATANKVLSRDPSNARILLKKARALFDGGDKKEASEILDKALQIYIDADPGFKRLKEANELSAQFSS